MAMVAGTVTLTGGVASGAGFAREVYDYLASSADLASLSADQRQAAGERLAAIANATALLVTHLQTFGVVSTLDTGVNLAASGTGVIT